MPQSLRAQWNSVESASEMLGKRLASYILRHQEIPFSPPCRATCSIAGTKNLKFKFTENFFFRMNLSRMRG